MTANMHKDIYRFHFLRVDLHFSANKTLFSSYSYLFICETSSTSFLKKNLKFYSNVTTLVSDVSVLEVVFVLLLNKRKIKKYHKKEMKKRRKEVNRPTNNLLQIYCSPIFEFWA